MARGCQDGTAVTKRQGRSTTKKNPYRPGMKGSKYNEGCNKEREDLEGNDE